MSEELTVVGQKEIDHYGKQAFPCPYCQVSYETESGLLHHERTRHPDKPRTTSRGDEVCPECGYKSSQHGVSLHRRLAHGVMGQWSKKRTLGAWTKTRTEGAFGCPYCEFRSGAKSGITRHINNQHPNETGVAMMGQTKPKPVGKPDLLWPNKGDNSSMMEKVMGMVADRIYNKLMEEL